MYKARQAEIIKEYNGKIIAVKDGECLGAFGTLVEAYREMVAKNYAEGEYIIIKCTPGDSEYAAFFANWFVFDEPVHV
jgi:hypothetical protein